MEYLTYDKLNTIIKRQYPIVKSTTDKDTTDKDTTANSLLDFYKDPNFNRIKTAFTKAVEPPKENRDDIDSYVYFSKNYT